MIALVCIAVAIVVVIIAGLVVAAARTKAQKQTEIAAKALADSFAREAKAAAEKKAADIAGTEVKKLEGASHEDLVRTARDLARRD